MASGSKQEAKHAPDIEHVPLDATPFQRREWIAQRIGWVLLGLILLAAMAGVFGNGPLADRTIGNESASLKYQRFVRRNADARWQVTARGIAAGSNLDIAIDAAFASNFEIKAVHPEPSSAALSGGSWVYSFETRDAGEVIVDFAVQPRRVGRHSGTITVSGAPAFHLSQLVYP